MLLRGSTDSPVHAGSAPKGKVDPYRFPAFRDPSRPLLPVTTILS
jgi:hypothetical protein